MGEKNIPEPITKPKLLLVEGQNEVFLFSELLKVLNLNQNIDIREVGGKDQFPRKIHVLKSVSGYNLVKSFGFLRDADDNPEGAFQSICSVLEKVNLPKPYNPMQPIEGPPQVTVMIIPDDHTKGMLETVCLESVKDDPAMPCVDGFFDCIKTKRDPLSENVIPKAKARVFLASRYTPDLNLGIAAQKTDDRYWDFDHPAFDKIKQFLQML